MIPKNSEENAQLKSSARPDAFQKYSNDAVRMKRLLLKEDDDEFDVRDFARRHYITDAAINLPQDGISRVVRSEVPTSSGASRGGSSAIDDRGGKEEQVVDRKTRISFELHPALLFEEILEDLYGPDDAQDGSDIESDVDFLSLFDNRETTRQ
mmetsp:Transcript_6343/g.15788  ORF Transcript_6343/g.15788 Transcript_6343/m.15788 type:complete len:153 (-) Transcript_6343:209-667(-)